MTIAWGILPIGVGEVPKPITRAVDRQETKMMFVEWYVHLSRVALRVLTIVGHTMRGQFC